MNFKNYILLTVVLILSACNSESKKLIFKRQTSKNVDEYYLSTSTQSVDGQVKAIRLNNNVYLSYRFIYKYDTSGNTKVDKSLFLGKPTDYSSYLENLDSIASQIKGERKRYADSLKQAKKNSESYGEDGLPLFLYKIITDSTTINSEAKELLQNLKESKRKGTYPIYYSDDAYYKTRSPKFQIQYLLRFIDKDDFEITSFPTDEFPVSPFQDNIIEGKIDVGYKNLDDFKNEVFNKTKKVFITIKSANL